jgi:hypothetical protein
MLVIFSYLVSFLLSNSDPKDGKLSGAIVLRDAIRLLLILKVSCYCHLGACVHNIMFCGVL